MTISLRIRSSHGASRLTSAVIATLLLVPLAGPLPAAAQGSPGPSPVDGPRIPHDVPGLEATFPDSVDGRPLFRLSMGRPSFEGMGDASLGDLDALLTELGVVPTDLELAFANDPTASPLFNYLAFRVAGVTGTTLVDTYGRLVPRTEVDATVQRITIDGREVVRVSMPYNPIPNLWFWADGDTLVGIQAADEAAFEKLYGLLPGALPSPGASPSAEPAG